MTDRRLPDYLLERLALDELPEETRRRSEEQLAREPGGTERLTKLSRSDAELLTRYPPQVVAREIARRQRKLSAPARARWTGWLAIPAATLATATALWLLVLPAPERTSIKGDATLLVYRNTGEPNLLQNGATARAGDVVQLAYARVHQAYGVIVSLDGAGKVTLHLPEHESEAARLVRDARTQLPHSYELDAAPSFERFFLVTSDGAFRTSVAEEAARKLAARGEAARTDSLSLPPNFQQSSFLLVKANR